MSIVACRPTAPLSTRRSAPRSAAALLRIARLEAVRVGSGRRAAPCCAGLSRPLVLAWLAAAGLVPAGLAAQSRTTSALRGTVALADGSPVVGAAVRLLRSETGAVRSALTNAEGRFLLLLVQPGGPYTLTLGHLGFAEERREDIHLRVGATETIEVVLREQPIGLEGIDVEVSRADVFNPDRVGHGLTLDARDIEATPLISRDLFRLTELSPLVRTTEQGGFSIGGQNDRYNALLIDGVMNKDLFGLTSGGVPGGQAGARLIPLDAVDQYEVLVAPYDVRLTGFTGGVLNAVTRSGTNRFQGRGSAVVRNEAMTGDLTLPTGPVDVAGARRRILGLSLGGPIRRDRAHFFVAAEIEQRTQPPDGYNLLREPSSLVRVTPENAELVSGILGNQYGIDPGEVGPYDLDRGLVNVFGRVDWAISDRHRLTLRHILAAGRSDASPARSAYDAYAFSSNAVLRESVHNTTSLQLFSDLGALGGNELTLSVQRSSDETRPVADGPQIEVEVESEFGEFSAVRAMRAGGHYFAQDNDLEQTSVRLSNALTLQGDGGATTLGVSGALHGFRHRFLPAADGHWFFRSVDDLIDNRPYRYERGILAEGEDPAVRFSVLEWGAFAQHQIATSKGLTMRFGIRLDMPRVLDHPPLNHEVMDWFGPRTSYVPSGMLMISPRWGFNWQSDGERRWQVRSGVGLFTGQIPYVWLAEAFHNDGRRSATRVCTGRVGAVVSEGNTVPPFQPGVDPRGCQSWLDTGEGEPFELSRAVTVFRRSFVYPQELKFSIVADRELTERLSASFSALFSHAINQVVLEEANLGAPSSALEDTATHRAFGGAERQRFGRPSFRGYEPNRVDPALAQVLLVGNETQDWSFTVAAELRGTIASRLEIRGGYSFSRSFDHMSLIAPDMISNYGLNAIAQDPNGPALAASNFDRPHKIVLSLAGAPFPGPFERTELILLYTGESGIPFSYVYGGDANGDGYPGTGPAFDKTNDLLYVPEDLILFPVYNLGRELFGRAIEEDRCLSRHRGGFLPRNACRTPWQHRLDLRVAQAIPLGGADVRLEADLVNVLNLVNGEWGRAHTIRPVVPLLNLTRRSPELPPPLRTTWGSALLPELDADGEPRAADPWSIVSPESQWQLQLGLRVGFGGGAR